MASPTLRRNILLLVADDLGREQMGCYGSKMDATPNLDALAQSGARFDMAFTSTASCSGSRTVIYTGLHTHENGSYGLTHGRNGFQTLPDVETMPEVFNGLDYKTGIVGKVHVGPDGAYPWQLRYESETRDVAEIAKVSEEFMQSSRQEDKPFFLTVGFVDPHRHIPSRAGFGNVGSVAADSRVFDPKDVEIPRFLSDTPEVRQEMAEYMRAIHRLDHGVGLILEALDRNNLATSTMVVFLSDNGPPFVNSKTTLFDAGVRLPLLVRAPGLGESGVVNRNLVSYIDIFPTFLDWVGHGGKNASPGKISRRGRSFLPILNSTTVQDAWDHVFGSHTFHEITNYWPTRFMRNTRYKYHRNVTWKLDFPFAMDLYASISFQSMRESATSTSPAMVGPRKLVDYIRRPPEELFDMLEDPDEIHNLAGDPAHKETLESMRRDLEAWQRDTKDLWLWRDGVAVTRFVSSEYAREGLCIPNTFDFELEKKSAGVYSLD